jgi:hypothetical protein
MSRRRLFILIVLIALAGAIAVVLWPESPVEEPGVDEPVASDESLGEAALQQRERVEEPFVANEQIASEVPLRPKSGKLLRFTIPDSGKSPGVEATIGMAGMWPPAEASAPAGGLIPLPITEVSTLWGDKNNSYEVFAHTIDRTHAFWGEVSTDELNEPTIHEVELGSASPLEVVVTDDGGQPVADAEVRISRGFVALVHLSKQTDQAGTASFTGLPDGEFQVTVQADTFARHMRQVVHSGGDHPSAGEPVALSLVKGPTKIGNGELERLAKEVVADGNRTVVQTGDEPGEGEGEDGAERTRHPLDLYVVDRAGSPVHGALIQIWRDGRRLFEKKSAGREPVLVELESPFRGTLVGFDGQRGEGSMPIVLTERANTNEFIVTLDRDLLTLDLPPGRINARGRIEQILGVELVRDNDAWLADVLSPSSAAAKAGIERGDRVVFLREVSGGYSALIERGNQRMRVQVPSGH